MEEKDDHLSLASNALVEKMLTKEGTREFSFFPIFSILTVPLYRVL